MNKKILGALVSLFTLALLMIPVMAAPATKIEGVTLETYTEIIPDPDSLHLADHNIVINSGTAIGSVRLNITETQSLVGAYSGTWRGVSKWTGFPVPNPEAENIVRGKMVLTFTGEGTTGTFEGVTHIKTIGLPPLVASYTEVHVVLRGTGDFQGQTLRLSYEGAPPAVLEGCLIIPN